jgi:hypothetical protein
MASSTVYVRLPFDVFRRERAGLSWLGSVATVEEAHVKIFTEPNFESLEYTIVNTTTGNRIHIGPLTTIDDVRN